MKDTLCIGGGHSHHQFGVNLVGFHAIIFTVFKIVIKPKSLGFVFRFYKSSPLGLRPRVSGSL